jgi:5-methylcytosine-specific restriction protein A
MPWQKKTREERQRDQRVYGDPAYQRHRAYAIRRANGRCEKCGRPGRRLQVDHIIPVTQGGTHDESNLQVLCSGQGSCHAAKTATEGSKHGRPSDPEHVQRTDWNRMA